MPRLGWTAPTLLSLLCLLLSTIIICICLLSALCCSHIITSAINHCVCGHQSDHSRSIIVLPAPVPARPHNLLISTSPHLHLHSTSPAIPALFSLCSPSDLRFVFSSALLCSALLCSLLSSALLYTLPSYTPPRSSSLSFFILYRRLAVLLLFRLLCSPDCSPDSPRSILTHSPSHRSASLSRQSPRTPPILSSHPILPIHLLARFDLRPSPAVASAAPSPAFVLFSFPFLSCYCYLPFIANLLLLVCYPLSSGYPLSSLVLPMSSPPHLLFLSAFYLLI
ncbi:hypothetical protein BZA70DRAFT_266972 [Myxozyma melibiosi]|uniref:Uncharacterized protein n=1 Tax=Myxozyma melibiosi TaxID=54550 RepID=A0ABR1F7P8_9ASCO